MALCREQYGDDSAIVFGWVLASHQVGAVVVAFLGGVARDVFGRRPFFRRGGHAAWPGARWSRPSASITARGSGARPGSCPVEVNGRPGC